QQVGYRRGCLEKSEEEAAVWLRTRVREVIPMSKSKPYSAVPVNSVAVEQLTRLIADAGCDPYDAISADPQDDSRGRFRRTVVAKAFLPPVFLDTSIQVARV